MASAIGTLALVEEAKAVGPVRFLRCTLTGDANYGAATNGTAGLLAKLQALMGQPNLNILSVTDCTAPTTTLSRLEYDHAGDKLLARVKTTGVESAVDNQSAITYILFIIAS